MPARAALVEEVFASEMVAGFYVCLIMWVSSRFIWLGLRIARTASGLGSSSGSSDD